MGGSGLILFPLDIHPVSGTAGWCGNSVSVVVCLLWRNFYTVSCNTIAIYTSTSSMCEFLFSPQIHASMFGFVSPFVDSHCH